MNNKSNDPLIDRLDPTLLNEKISNDQFFDTPDEFEAKHSQNIIDKLIHLSRFGNLLTLVVGDNGCGKSYLLDRLISSVDDSCQICHITSQPLLSIEQLFQQVIESFAGEATFTGIPLTANQYEEWAEQLAAIPGNRLLIIDDTEVLSTSVLHELCQLSAMQQEKETPHLHLILFGNYDLNNILEQASHGILSEDGIYAIDIPSLDEEGSKEWLEYLFNRDGVVFVPEAEALEKMLIKGQGNLSLLEEEAAEYTAISHELDDFENEPKPWRVSGVGYWFGSLTVLIMMVLGLFFFQKELTELFGIEDEQLPLLVKEQTVLDATTTVETDSGQSNDEIKLDDSVISEIENDESLEKIVDKSSVLLDEPIDASENTSESNIDGNIEQGTDDIQNIEKSAAEKGLVKAVITQQIADSNNGSIEDTERGDEVVSSIPVENISQDIAPREENLLTQDEQLIMSFSEEDYAVQLIGLRKESDVKSFITQHGLTKVLYYKSSLAEKPWYIVILANYNSKEDAILARLNLSDDLKKHGPWIKSLKAIKNELTNAQLLFNAK